MAVTDSKHEKEGENEIDNDDNNEDNSSNIGIENLEVLLRDDFYLGVMIQMMRNGNPDAQLGQ